MIIFIYYITPQFQPNKQSRCPIQSSGCKLPEPLSFLHLIIAVDSTAADVPDIFSPAFDPFSGFSRSAFEPPLVYNSKPGWDHDSVVAAYGKDHDLEEASKGVKSDAEVSMSRRRSLDTLKSGYVKPHREIRHHMPTHRDGNNREMPNDSLHVGEWRGG